LSAAPPNAKPAEGTGAVPGSGNKVPLHEVQSKPTALGKEHKLLAGLVGHWKPKVRMIEAAAPVAAPADSVAPPSPDSGGTAEGKLVMGGRFVQVAQQGVLDGQPYEALTMFGFDNVTNRYTSLWIDGTSNGMIHFVGTYDAAKKQLTMSAHYSDPTTRRLTISKTVTTFVDANNWTYDEYIAHAVGEKEKHTMSITFTRG